jgi:acyl dehydratase
MTLVVGQEFGPVDFQISRDSLVRYAGASGDFNPIHYRDDFALQVGLPGVLAHGMLTMGVAIQVVADAVGGSEKILDYQVRFTKPVVVAAIQGATLSVSAKVAEVLEGEARLDITAKFQYATVLGKAQARVKL